MGKDISKLSQRICMKSSQYKVLVLGLEGSGKTTLCDRLKYNEIYVRYPTIGFIVDNVSINKLQVTIWDFGGHSKIMKLWHNYFEYTDLVVVVVDSTNNEQNEEVKCIFKMLEEKLPGIYVIILLNKIDLKCSWDVKEFIEVMELDKFKVKIAKIIRTSLVNGTEMKEIRESIANVLKSIPV
jgi:small GTP-binding protein